MQRVRPRVTSHSAGLPHVLFHPTHLSRHTDQTICHRHISAVDGEHAADLECRQSVGHVPAMQAILLATYRALALLPPTHTHPNLQIPLLPDSPLSSSAKWDSSPPKASQPCPHAHLGHISLPASPYTTRPGSPSGLRATPLPPLGEPLFQFVWLALAGISMPADGNMFMPHVLKGLCVSEERVKITNGASSRCLQAPSACSVEHELNPESRCEHTSSARLGLARDRTRPGSRMRDGYCRAVDPSGSSRTWTIYHGGARAASPKSTSRGYRSLPWMGLHVGPHRDMRYIAADLPNPGCATKAQPFGSADSPSGPYSNTPTDSPPARSTPTRPHLFSHSTATCSPTSGRPIPWT